MQGDRGEGAAHDGGLLQLEPPRLQRLCARLREGVRAHHAIVIHNASLLHSHPGLQGLRLHLAD